MAPERPGLRLVDFFVEMKWPLLSRGRSRGLVDARRVGERLVVRRVVVFFSDGLTFAGAMGDIDGVSVFEGLRREDIGAWNQRNTMTLTVTLFLVA